MPRVSIVQQLLPAALNLIEGTVAAAAGAMGVRTAHQQDAKAQLTVEAAAADGGDTADAPGGGEGGGYGSGEDAAALDEALQGGAGEAELKVLWSTSGPACLLRRLPGGAGLWLAVGATSQQTQ